MFGDHVLEGQLRDQSAQPGKVMTPKNHRIPHITGNLSRDRKQSCVGVQNAASGVTGRCTREADLYPCREARIPAF